MVYVLSVGLIVAAASDIVAVIVIRLGTCVCVCMQPRGMMDEDDNWRGNIITVVLCDDKIRSNAAKNSKRRIWTVGNQTVAETIVSQWLCVWRLVRLHWILLYVCVGCVRGLCANSIQIPNTYWQFYLFYLHESSMSFNNTVYPDTEPPENQKKKKNRNTRKALKCTHFIFHFGRRRSRVPDKRHCMRKGGWETEWERDRERERERCERNEYIHIKWRERYK